MEARDEELHCYLRTVDECVGDGVPIALKDVISTRGVETTAGSRILEGYVPVFDATVARACEGGRPAAPRQDEHGRVRDGLVDGELRLGPVAQPLGSRARARRLRRGSAAAVTAGLAPWALGSDTGGSIKQPSALCGNVGLRPTYGTVSRYGVVAFASSLDQIGPVAKTVRDCALLYSIVAGRDPSDSTTVEAPAVELPVDEDLRGLRIGVPRELNEHSGIEPGVRAAVGAAIALAEELGAEVGECELPRSVEFGLPCYYLIAPAEASSNLARYDGVRYGPPRRGGELPRDGRAHPRRGIRRRAEAPDHARNLRALRRLLRRVLRPGAEGADADRPGAPGGVRAVRPARVADLSDRGAFRSASGLPTRSRCTPPTC